MRFIRLIIVAVLVTACGGAFGGAVGALVGYAVPSGLSMMFGIEKHQAKTDAIDMQAQRDDASAPSNVPSTQQKQEVGVGVNVQTKNHLAPQGAAIGAAWGLILGSIFGILLGVIDQIVLLLKDRAKRPQV